MLEFIVSIYWIVASGVLGAVVGSFLNVVIYRLPMGLSLVSPGSRCPSCATPLGVTENIPILGWLWLKGRCKHCGVGISPRYPLVETLTCVLFAVATSQIGFGMGSIAACILLSFLVALSLIDFDTLELPNELMLPAIWIGLGWQILADLNALPNTGFSTGLLGFGVAVLLLDAIAIGGRSYLWLRTEPRIGPLVPKELGMALIVLTVGCIAGLILGDPVRVTLLVYGGVLLVWESYLIVRDWVVPVELNQLSDSDSIEDELTAFGGGDVLLGGLLGMWLGWQGFLIAMVVGFLLAGVYVFVLSVLGKIQILDKFALGPFLAMGGVFSLLTGSWLADSYLKMIGFN